MQDSGLYNAILHFYREWVTSHQALTRHGITGCLTKTCLLKLFFGTCALQQKLLCVPQPWTLPWQISTVLPKELNAAAGTCIYKSANWKWCCNISKGKHLRENSHTPPQANLPEFLGTLLHISAFLRLWSDNKVWDLRLSAFQKMRYKCISWILWQKFWFIDLRLHMGNNNVHETIMLHTDRNILLLQYFILEI